MLALSVRQPYASDIASGTKRFEYRPWAPVWDRQPYRGPLLICSTKAPKSRFPIGCTVCIVRVIGVERLLCTLTWAWELSGAIPVPNVPVKGKLGLWMPSYELIEEITKGFSQ